MSVLAAQLESYLENFTDFARATAAETPQWLRDLRDAAFARFCETGFPTTHDEDWRFTSLAALTRTPFRLAPAAASPFTVSELVAWRMEDAAARPITRLVFVDGRFAPELSTWGTLPAGVTVNSLRKEIQHRPAAVAEHLGRYLDIERDPFAALNTAFLEDGAYVHVARGVVVEAPIHLLFIATASAAPVMTHPRNLVVVEDEAEGRNLFGLYRGHPLTGYRIRQWSVHPDKITIYRRTICEHSRSIEEVRAQVYRTVIHEIAHHFGIDDPRLRELGW